jgi:hypothetical protein
VRILLGLRREARELRLERFHPGEDIGDGACRRRRGGIRAPGGRRGDLGRKEFSVGAGKNLALDRAHFRFQPPEAGFRRFVLRTDGQGLYHHYPGECRHARGLHAPESTA